MFLGPPSSSVAFGASGRFEDVTVAFSAKVVRFSEVPWVVVTCSVVSGPLVWTAGVDATRLSKVLFGLESNFGFSKLSFITLRRFMIFFRFKKIFLLLEVFAALMLAIDVGSNVGCGVGVDIRVVDVKVWFEIWGITLYL